MKKRLLSCLALLLLVAMLLCSCAEGLPLSELYFAAKDAATEFTTQLKLLQSGSMTIAADGKSEYEISFDRAASKEVKDAVNALAARIKKQTGADLLNNKGENVTKRIVIGQPEKGEDALVSSATQFYLGFAGNDLMIQACNDMMLISALSFFTEKYLDSKEGALILSPDLSYLSPAAVYRTKEHNFIRAEQTGATAAEALKKLCNTLEETTGVRFSVKSDFNSSGGLTDILFGYPDDDEAQAILKTLSFDDFYIGVRDGRLMILAKNDPALVEATDLFLSTFVTAENATFDEVEKTITLPTVCDYYHRSDAILMAEDGINRTVLIYAANASNTVKNAALNFAALYKRLTNTDLPIHKDSEYRPNIGAFEILVGETDRELPQQTYLETLPNGQWVVSVVPEANAISVFAKGEMALLVAMDQLGKALTEQVRAISKLSSEENAYLDEGSDRTLYIKPSFSLNGLEPPDFPVAANYRFYNSYYKFNSAVQVNENIWNRYNYYIRWAGFVRQSQSERDGVTTAVYQSETRTVTLIYNKTKKSLELRVSFVSPK